MQFPSFPVRFITIVAPLILVAIFPSGCTSTRAHYANYEDGKLTGWKSVSSQEGDRFSLAFIEFGEQGSFQDPSQLQAAEKLIASKAKPLVIAYVHGWHNNSASHDVERFRGFLREVTDNARIRNSGFTVVGIYLGWRGESLSVPVINSLSFWNRKAAAERLASNNDCIDAIWSLTSKARAKGSDSNYTILIGHSFGGLVVERTVAHSLVTGMHSGQNALPADLIITLNPAGDSILTRQMIASFDSRMSFQNGNYVSRESQSRLVLPGNRQLIVGISAENDRATGTMFPIGSNLGAIGKRWDRVPPPGLEQKSVSERLYFTNTPGNNKTLVNHHVAAVDSSAPLKGENAVDANLSNNIKDGIFYTSDTNDPQKTRWRRWQIAAKEAVVQTPYWLIQVPREIINDHGGIWSPNAQAMLAAVFRMNFPLQKMASGEVKPAAPNPVQLPKARDYNRLQSKEPANEPASPRNP